MTQDHERPLPVPTIDTQGYWHAVNEGRLVFQRCLKCGELRFYPRAFCVSCLSDELIWELASGRGRIYTFTICHIPGNPAMAEKIPYAMAMIDLDEGVRMLAGIIESQLSHIHIGAAVEVVFERLTPDLSLPQFTLCKSG